MSDDQGGWGAGWYPDPWFGGQRRYWDGRTWTPAVAPDHPADHAAAPGQSPAPEAAPAVADQGPSTETLPVGGHEPPAAAGSASEAGAARSSEPPAPAGSEPGLAQESPAARPPAARHTRRNIGVALVVVAVITFAVGLTTAVAFRPSKAIGRAPGTALRPTTTVAPDPDLGVVRLLVVHQTDVDQSSVVRLIPGGDSVAGETTLDLCDATFPSEGLRTARRQVSVADAGGRVGLSTEAVLYTNPGGTAQAFTELRTAAAHCPPTPPPTTPAPDQGGSLPPPTSINPAPDGAWPTTPTVERLAFDFVTTDQRGQRHRQLAVFLRRGRVLVGVYFAGVDPTQEAVAGQTSIPSIVSVFAARMAKLDPAVITRNA